MTNYCPACGDEVHLPVNSQECEFLIIEEFPELILPTPAIQSKWAKDEWTPKKILISELAKVGMVWQQFRIVSVYSHLPPDSGMPNENCYNLGFDWAMNEVPSKKGIIVLGGNLCKTLTGYELKQVQGLSNVTWHLVSEQPRVFLPTLRSIYVSGVGEFGLGLRRFVEQIGE